LYAYVVNNPVESVDPDGLLPMDGGGSWERLNDAMQKMAPETKKIFTQAVIYLADKAIGFVPGVGDVYGFGKALYKAHSEGGLKGGVEGILELLKGYLGSKTNSTVGFITDVAQDVYGVVTGRDLSCDIVNLGKATINKALNSTPQQSASDNPLRFGGRSVGF
jgi:hypothetical protein